MAARRGSSLIIACVILFIVATIATVALERIIPVSQGTRGVEGSNIAYYQAQNGVEAVLMQMARNNPYVQPSATGGSAATQGYGAGGASFTWVIPAPGEGNSDYSSDWNKIGPNDPVQIFLTGGSVGASPYLDWSQVDILFRVPQVASTGAVSLSGGYYAASGTGLIAWTMASSNGAFFGPMTEDQVFSVEDVNDSQGSSPVGTLNSRPQFSVRIGRDDASATGSVSQFVAGSTASHPDCDAVTNLCTLRLFGIRPIVVSGGQTLPYLEYQIKVRPSGDCVQTAALPNPCLPDRFLKISSSGYSYGFKRDIVKKVPQATAVQGLDVTVFN